MFIILYQQEGSFLKRMAMFSIMIKPYHLRESQTLILII